MRQRIGIVMIASHLCCLLQSGAEKSGNGYERLTFVERVMMGGSCSEAL